jgi:hypothetical protein
LKILIEKTSIADQGETLILRRRTATIDSNGGKAEVAVTAREGGTSLLTATRSQ